MCLFATFCYDIPVFCLLYHPCCMTCVVFVLQQLLVMMQSVWKCGTIIPLLPQHILLPTDTLRYTCPESCVCVCMHVRACTCACV